MWALVVLVGVSAVEEQWTKDDANEFAQLHTAFTEMYSKVYKTEPDTADNIPYDVDLPAGWNYMDVVEKCGKPGDEKEHSAADCLKLAPAILTGYWEEIKEMEEGFRANNPKPLLPLPGWTPPAHDQPTSFLETAAHDEGKSLTGAHSRLHSDLKALEGVHMMSKSEIKAEARKVLAAMHAHTGIFAEKYHKRKYNNKYMDPNFVKMQIRHLGQLQQHMREESAIRKKRDAPILADLQDIQEQQKLVAQKEEEENKEEIDEAKSMARVDWERAHAVRPPRINPGKPGDPDYQANLEKMWSDAQSRGKDEDQHEEEELKRLQKIAERHRTPSPSQELERQLTERMLIDDEKLEGRQPSEEQLEEAGLAKPKKPKQHLSHHDIQLKHRLDRGKADLNRAREIGDSLRKG